MNLQIKHKHLDKIYTVYATDPPSSGRGFTRFLVFEPESNYFEWVFSGDFIPYTKNKSNNKSKKRSKNKSKTKVVRIKPLDVTIHEVHSQKKPWVDHLKPRQKF